MEMLYENSPIHEVVCEFRLPPDVNWDLAIPGLVYELLRDDFPTRQGHVFARPREVRIAEGELTQQVELTEGVRFLTDEGRRFVQMRQRVLSVNCLKPYPGWDSFKPMIEKAFSALVETTAPSHLQRIGLRYVNLVQIPTQGRVRLEDYFGFYPQLESSLPESHLDFTVACEIPFRGQDVCRMQLRSAESGERSLAFVLDLDYFNKPSSSVAVGTALNWVDSAHGTVSSLFEGCIKDPLRNLFRGEGT